MTHRKHLKALVPLHEGFDIMDAFGPIEILSLASQLPLPDDTPSNFGFEVAITAHQPLTRSTAGVDISRHLSLEDAAKALPEFDMLIVPGGSSQEILDNERPGPVDLIRAFAALPRRQNNPRLIMSVCTGALFLAKAGILGHQTVITNTSDMDRLREMLAGSTTEVSNEGKRFVVNIEGGSNGQGLKGCQIMTSAGPGAGLDMSLWLVEHLAGAATRKNVEKLTEYGGRVDDGLILD